MSTIEFSTALVALAATCICVIAATILVFRKVQAPENHPDFEEVPDRARVGAGENGVERLMGDSFIEKLVPEIKSQIIRFLDYNSLCCLSMTNSVMKEAVDDDEAWKILYYKDFTPEDANITPTNGWKAYYATTKAVFSINASYFRILKEKQLQAMSELWLNAKFVKCFHDSTVSYIGYEAVMESWRVLFSWDNDANYDVRHVRARILGDIAWLTMKTYVEAEVPAYNVTNVFEFHNGRWYLVLHQCSPAVGNGGR